MFWIITGSLAAALTTFSFIPQIIKVYKHKSAKDVSLITLMQLATGVFLWIIYGFYLRDPIVIAANSITFLSLTVLIVLCNIYKK